MADPREGDNWRGIRVTRDPASVGLVNDLTDAVLMPGDVTIDVEYSSINFKDGLALTGRPGVVRAPELIAGIDLVGTVSASRSPDWHRGDRVLVNGCGLGETHHGGLAERARVDAAWLIPVPHQLSTSQAAAIGTAGFTAMLAILELERTGAEGDILVTGATGGVGSIAIALLSRLGFAVTASTGRAEEHQYLRDLGATEVIDRIPDVGKPLQKERWGGVIESVGGTTLSNVLAQARYGATVASIGNAQSADFPGSVYPFILRGVRLSGINSVLTPIELRREAWTRLARDLDLAHLDSMTETVSLADAIPMAQKITEGGVRGRTVVDVRA
ncbi:MDR family oxidoreductase [soil metagenome]